MNAHAELKAASFAGAVSPLRRATEAKERAALRSLALTEKRLSWRYRRWALEAEADGNNAAFLRWAAEARRLWREAKSHLEHARRRSI